METIFPNGKVTKDQLVERIERADKLLQLHVATLKPLRHQCANQIADALGCIAKCLIEQADRALDAAEVEAAKSESETAKRPRTFTLADLVRIIAAQRASLPEGPGHPMQGWPA